MSTRLQENAMLTLVQSDLNLNGTTRSPERRTGPPTTNGGPRRENIPPRPYGRGPPGHRPAPSEEERRRRDANMRAQKGELDIFADPVGTNGLKEQRRPRRNSESSVKDKASGLDPEEEKKRRERKYRESKYSKGAKKPSKRLDIIDKLDVTSIYGMGCTYYATMRHGLGLTSDTVFHHDGPFDACNPHRNRKGARAAPMHAFPEGSLNMQLGGSGPLKKNIDIEQYHGRGQEAHGDFNEAAVVDEDAAYFRRPLPERSGSFNPHQRAEPIHGSETAGLGTSTFLEGAPASKKAIERRESEYEQQAQQQGLSRKKSLAQRIRGNRSNTIGNRAMSPEGAAPVTPLDTGRSDSNANPFFKDYDQEYEKKGAQIAFAEEEQKRTRARAPSSPRRELPAPLSRTKTADSMGPEPGKSSGGGFLSRVKSLKGGRRARPERRDTSG